jgi:hypothetical protein
VVVFHVIVVLLIVGAARGSSAHDLDTLSSASVRPEVRGCRERAEGGKIVPDRTVDTVIGPMAFIRLPGTYRSPPRDRIRSRRLAQPSSCSLAIPLGGMYA